MMILPSRSWIASAILSNWYSLGPSRSPISREGSFEICHCAALPHSGLIFSPIVFPALSLASAEGVGGGWPAPREAGRGGGGEGGVMALGEALGGLRLTSVVGN